MTSKVRAGIKRKVDQLFNDLNAKRGDYCVNPVTGGRFIWGDDPVEPQKETARRALAAREWFAKNGPAYWQPLAITHEEREHQKSHGMHIPSWFARSLEAHDYDLKRHPSWKDFACGVMARPETPDFIRCDLVLQRTFPPRHLDGLGPGQYWGAPIEAARRATAKTK
jgi:hypothetical protein